MIATQWSGRGGGAFASVRSRMRVFSDAVLGALVGLLFAVH